MPTLELLHLQLRPGATSTSPALLTALSSVRAHVQTGSRFYQSLEDSSHLFILGEWASADAHAAFLSNTAERERVLRPQEQLAAFGWCVHVDLLGRMSEVLPLGAGVLVLTRWWVKRGEGEAGFEGVVRRYGEEVGTGTDGKVFGGWVVDEEQQQEGSKVYVMLSGWESRREHLEWRETTGRDVPEFAGMGRRYCDRGKGEEGMETVHLIDIERMVERGESV